MVNRISLKSRQRLTHKYGDDLVSIRVQVDLNSSTVNWFKSSIKLNANNSNYFPAAVAA